MPRKRTLSDAERKKRKDEANARYREKMRSKGKPKSWVKALGEKFDAASEGPSRSGDPFADLPPLDLPSTPAPSIDETAGASPSSTGEAEDSTSSKVPAGDTASASIPAEDQIDADEVADYLSQMYGQLLRAGSMYAAEHGEVALGEPFIKMGEKGVQFLVKKYATELGVSTEDAAWAGVAFTGGFTGYQCYSVWRDEQKKKKAAESPQPQQQGAPTNGHPAATPDPRARTDHGAAGSEQSDRNRLPTGEGYA